MESRSDVANLAGRFIAGEAAELRRSPGGTTEYISPWRMTIQGEKPTQAKPARVVNPSSLGALIPARPWLPAAP